MIKKITAALIALLFSAPWACAQLVQGFGDIENWAGTGTNSSALVIQWNDGGTPTSLVWGYRWNSGATGNDMLYAIAGMTRIQEAGSGDLIENRTGSDSLLNLVVDRYNFGDAVYSITYNPGGPMRTQADWDSGYWEYSIFAGNFQYYEWDGSGYNGPFTYNVAGNSLYSGVQWSLSQIGASDRLLVDGSWDALNFAPGFISSSIAQPAPAAVPEPSVLGLLALAGLAVIFTSRRMRRAG